MKMVLLILVLLHCFSVGQPKRQITDTMVKRDSFLKMNSSDPHIEHELVIAVKQNKLDILHDTLMERSTPGNDLYQQWMTSDEIGKLTLNQKAIEAIQTWLSNNNISITRVSKHSNYIHAIAPINVWERTLQTKFHVSGKNY